LSGEGVDFFESAIAVKEYRSGLDDCNFDFLPESWRGFPLVAKGWRHVWWLE